MSQPKKRFSSKEFLRNFGSLADLALREPIVITKSGRDRLVLLSIEAFDELVRANESPNAARGGEREPVQGSPR